jgi:hypothetical protein
MNIVPKYFYVHKTASVLVAASFFLFGTAFAQDGEQKPEDKPPASSNAAPAAKQGDAAELAKKLQNPVAALISVPIQSNMDWGQGVNGDGFQYKVNIQPVIPVSISKDWNIISRTILPVIYQQNIIGPNTSQAGIGDIVQSLFFSPQAPTKKGGLVWGAGPVFLLPSASDHVLGTEKWGMGPTVVVLKQAKGWTIGALWNHIWSFAGNESRQDVSATFFQPFVGYTTRKQTTYTINSESTYDWKNDQWTAPINLMVAQLVKVGGRPMQFQLGYRYYIDRPSNGPNNGLRVNVIFLYPR